MDTEARQLGLKYMQAAEQADTASTKLLEQARDASMAFSLRQDSASAGRRAVLAQQAYKHRVNAAVTRQMAAYALLAADAGDKAVSAQAVAAQVKDAQRQKVLITEAEHATKRRNLMLQAMEATKASLKNVPGLPAVYAGRPPSAEQTTVNGSTTWRSSEYVERAGTFFPADIRAAAGSFAGVGVQGHDAWFHGLKTALADCACKAEEACREQVKSVISSDPAAIGADQRADALVAKMKARGLQGLGSKMTPPTFETIKSNPIPSIAVGLGVVTLIYLAVRSRK